MIKVSKPISRVLSTISKVRDDILQGGNKMKAKLDTEKNLDNMLPNIETKSEELDRKAEERNQSVTEKVDNYLLGMSNEEKEEIHRKLQIGNSHKNVTFKKVSEMTVDEFYNYKGTQRKVLYDIEREREQQMAKWGHQKHDYNTWMAIAMEEVGEAFQALNSGLFSGKETDPTDYKGELVQSAAVIVAILEQLEEEEQNE